MSGVFPRCQWAAAGPPGPLLFRLMYVRGLWHESITFHISEASSTDPRPPFIMHARALCTATCTSLVHLCCMLYTHTRTLMDINGHIPDCACIRESFRAGVLAFMLVWQRTYALTSIHPSIRLFLHACKKGMYACMSTCTNAICVKAGMPAC